jgi:hypothetical protein
MHRLSLFSVAPVELDKTPVMSRFIIPALVVGFGILWMLDILGVTPPLGMVWIIGLAGIGVAIFASRGFNKETFPWGAFFFACAGCSLLRQLDVLSLKVELPLLVIILGVLLGINQTALIPAKSSAPLSPAK